MIPFLKAEFLVGKIGYVLGLAKQSRVVSSVIIKLHTRIGHVAGP